MQKNSSTNPESFSLLLSELKKIYGPTSLRCDQESINRYSHCTIADERKSLGIVFPDSAEKVSQTLKLANEFKIPIYPFSTGKNWGYGSTIPNDEHSIIMILERMNKIHEVNQDLGYVILEPGVTQKQLFDYLKNNNIPYWMDCTDSTPFASVVGNALERGIGYTTYGDHFAQLCGMEVVLPDGSIQSMDSLPGRPSRTFHTYKWGTGPFLDGLFSQSNFGIVTRVGLWLMPQPKTHSYFMIEMTDATKIDYIVDELRKLSLNRIISNVHIFNPYISSFAFEKFPFELNFKRLPLTLLQKIYKKWGIASWTMMGAVYGTHEQVEISKKIIQKHFKTGVRINFIGPGQLKTIEKISLYTKKIPILDSTMNILSLVAFGKKFSTVKILPKLLTYQRGEPSDFFISKAYYKNRKEPQDKNNLDPVRDNCGVYWLAPIVPAIGEEVKSFVDFVNEEFEKFNTEPSLTLIQLNSRTFIVAIMIVFDKEDATDTAKAKKIYYSIAENSQKLGYQQYRTSVAFMDKIIGRSTGPAIIGEKIKNVLDPNGILAPGRYGLGQSTVKKWKLKSIMAKEQAG